MRMGNKFEPGVWNLGKHYRWINLIAMIWVVIVRRHLLPADVSRGRALGEWFQLG